MSGTMCIYVFLEALMIKRSELDKEAFFCTQKESVCAVRTILRRWIPVYSARFRKLPSKQLKSPVIVKNEVFVCSP